MNILKKTYCRTFQAVFKLAMPLLPYRTPKQLDTVAKVSNILSEKKINNVLIVTDKTIKNLGLLIPLETSLDSKKIQYTIYSDTVPNPTIKNVEEAKDLYIKNNCQALIGFGGGSSIDCAKAVGARIAKPKQSIPKMKGILKINKKIPLLIAVPTTAGTGSETTVTTVITDETTRHKFPINDFPLIPSYAVLDAEVTKNLPPHITATTGIDALTHAVEAYIGNSTTKETRANAIKAVQLIFTNIEKAYNNGNDIIARKNMLYASFLAGSAFSKSYVGYCHAVAHSLGGKYNTAHGLANAVLLPHVLDAYGKSAYKKLKKLAIETKLAKKDTPCEKAAKRFIEKIRTLNKSLDIPETLPEIQEKDIEELAIHAEKEANPLYPVPKLMTAKELERFYYLIMNN